MTEKRYAQCQRCSKEIESQRTVDLVWNYETKTFANTEWDTVFDVFSFGADCAKKALDPKFDTLKEIRTSRKLWVPFRYFAYGKI